MRSHSTISFVSASEHEHRVMRSLFTIAGHRARTEWLLKDNQEEADVILIDADASPSGKLPATDRLRAKVIVAYSPRDEVPSGFDACLRKPVRSRELVALLDRLEDVLCGAGAANDMRGSAGSRT